MRALFALILVIGAAVLPTVQATDAQAREELMRSARLWELQRRDDLAAAAWEKLLLVEPDNARALLSLGLLRLRENKMAAVQPLVQRLQRLRPPAVEARQLADAYRVATRDRLKLATARRLVEMGKKQEAMQALKALYPDGPPPAQLGLEYYRLLAESPGERAAARAGLAQLAKDYPEDSRYRQALAGLSTLRDESGTAAKRAAGASRLAAKADRLREEGEAAMAAGDNGLALKKLEAALELAPDDPWLRFALAKLYVKLDLADEAAALMQEGVARQPGDADARYAQGLLLANLDDPAGALAALSAIPASRWTDGMRALQRRAQLGLAEQRAAAGDGTEARRLLQNLLQTRPQDPEVLLAAARIERADHRYDTALAYARRAQAAEQAQAMTPPSESTRSAAEAELDRLADRMDGFIAAGFALRGKPGDPGVSDLSLQQVPVELWLPFREGHLFAHLDTVRVDAGTLPAQYNSAALYGKVQAFGPGALASFPSGAVQQATGVAVGIGYENEAWRFDLGSTPLGFPVVDVVGGIRYDTRVGATDLTADVSRRPLTSSLLAYAGARDPVTGTVWGGVRSTGLSLRAGWDWARAGASLSTGYHFLEGRNVASNTYLSLRAAADWLFVDRPDTRLSAGAALSHWRYRDNLSGYTFGQGGYYSPQSYVALSLPVDWRGRVGRWSYRLRPAVSYSISRRSESPFYPTDAALQAMAAGSPLPSGYTKPFHDGGSGAGVGYSLKGALEYQLLPDYYIGAAYEMDRSEYYAPNAAMLYVRHHFQEEPRQVPYPPRPPRPYDEF